jgi:glycine oxidase
VKQDIAVIGGGAIGLAIARACALEGLKVSLIDENPGSGASSVAAGMLAPITELHYGEDALLALNLRSAAMFGDWIADIERATGVDTGYRKTGTIMVARDADENRALQEDWAHQRSLNLKAERLKGSDALSLERALSPRIRGGVLVEDDHQVEPAALVSALIEACRAAGVSFVGRRATRFEVERGRVRGVTIGDGDQVSAGAVVVAAGCWSASIPGLPDGMRIPVRPVKGQLLELGPVPGEPLIGRNVRGRDVYLVPRSDGRVVVGATVEERGFDTTVTAGAVLELLRDAYELVPGIAELTLLRAVAGLRPGTPDNAPLLGPTEVEGLLLATGHFRNGILLAPVTAQAIAATIATGSAPTEIADFSPLRFARAVA